MIELLQTPITITQTHIPPRIPALNRENNRCSRGSGRVFTGSRGSAGKSTGSRGSGSVPTGSRGSGVHRQVPSLSIGSRGSGGMYPQVSEVPPLYTGSRGSGWGCIRRFQRLHPFPQVPEVPGGVYQPVPEVLRVYPQIPEVPSLSTGSRGSGWWCIHRFQMFHPFPQVPEVPGGVYQQIPEVRGGVSTGSVQGGGSLFTSLLAEFVSLANCPLISQIWLI